MTSYGSLRTIYLEAAISGGICRDTVVLSLRSPFEMFQPCTNFADMQFGKQGLLTAWWNSFGAARSILHVHGIALASWTNHENFTSHFLMRSATQDMHDSVPILEDSDRFLCIVPPGDTNLPESSVPLRSGLFSTDAEVGRLAREAG